MNYDKYSGINDFAIPLFYMYTLFTDFCTSMQRPQTCLQKSLSCLQGREEKKKRHPQSVIFSNQSQPAPNESILCLVLIRGNFYLKQQYICTYTLRCSPEQARPNRSHFALWQLEVGQILCPASQTEIWEQFSWIEVPVLLWHRGAHPPRGATPSLAKASAKPGSDRSHGRLKNQTAVCSSEGKRPSRILFPLLDPQAHFCGVKSYFPVLRMLHFPLLLFERPTKTNGENNWLNRKQWNLQPTKCWEKGQSKQFFGSFLIISANALMVKYLQAEMWFLGWWCLTKQNAKAINISVILVSLLLFFFLMWNCHFSYWPCKFSMNKAL